MTAASILLSSGRSPPLNARSAARQSKIGIRLGFLDIDLSLVQPRHPNDCGPQTREIFSCPKCGLGYGAIRAQFPDKRAGRFECIDCFAEVHSWSGVYDCIGWKAIVMEPAVMGKKL